ncbi:hypothetical protein [Victivallis vadensis]|uniref:hypothetical protein n=1 Tax=Victivallis vadensis TaxID=172901 RepID=UPI0023F6AEA4|nr:hypothetical protein [Victivallis vadensis]
MLDPAKADEYFALHLRRSEWEAKSEDERAAALNMAEQDVSLELGGSELDYGNPLAVAAVCEQALFLLENSASGAAQVVNGALVSAESVDGIGSRTYRSGLTEADFAIGNRARRFIEQLRGGPGTVKINRG